jgi:hypothetical protein
MSDSGVVDIAPAVRMSTSVRRILMPELTQAVRSVMHRLADSDRGEGGL